MSVEISMGTPLADALNSAIRPKLVEYGWASDGGDDSPLSEYILLMLVNGKTQSEIANELAADLLNLGPDDPVVAQFVQWLFEQIAAFSTQTNGDSAPVHQLHDGNDTAMDQDIDSTSNDPLAELNAYVANPVFTNTLSANI
jgi:nuclear polyadenylated RNA-binding protein NAB2